MISARIGLPLALVLLAGCAINQDLRLGRSGPGLAPGATVAIAAAPEGNAEAARFAAALTDALAGQGYRVSGSAPVTAVFGFARRDRAIGTADGSAAAGSTPAGGITWISAPGRKRLLQSCKGERLRATLAFYAREEQGLIARVTGEIDGCTFTQDGIDALAKALVREAAVR